MVTDEEIISRDRIVNPAAVFGAMSRQKRIVSEQFIYFFAYRERAHETTLMLKVSYSGGGNPAYYDQNQ